MAEPIREKLEPLDEFSYQIFLSIDNQYITSCLTAISHFKIPDKLKEGPKTTEELAAEHSIIPDRLYRMLRLLASQGVFSYDPDNRTWSNTDLSLSLSSDNLGIITQIENLPALNETLMSFLPSLRSEKSAFELVHAKSLVEFMQDNKENSPMFIQIIDRFYEQQRVYLRELLKFESSSKMLMLGGGNGAYLCDILNENPGTTGAILDFSPIECRVLSNFEQQNISDRAQFIDGNILESIPQGYNIHIIKFILNIYSEDDVLRILSNSRRSLSDTGRCLIIEYVLEEENTSSVSPLIYDLYMLAYSKGLERSEREWVNILEKAHYKIEKRIPLEDRLNILICIPI